MFESVVLLGVMILAFGVFVGATRVEVETKFLIELVEKVLRRGPFGRRR